MPFFIPNRTKCAICHQPIENRFEAAELPYIDPATSSSLSQLARNFVHRECWNEWENAKFYAQAAFDLAKRGENQNTTFKIEFEADELIVFWIAALNSYQLKDFNLLATVELPLEFSPDQEVEILENPATLSGEDILFGFVLNLNPIMI